MKHPMNYLSLIQPIPAHRTALIEDGRFYIYGMFVMEACRVRSLPPKPTAPSVAWIRAASVHGRLVRFLAFNGASRIPIIVPADMKYAPESLTTGEIPAGACMGVPTSDSTGQPKLWFRTLGSWTSFSPIQNTIFGMTAQTRLFTQGDLTFTGSLNLYLSLLSLGASIITASHVNPFIWCREIELHHVDALCLISSKLRLLARYASYPSPDVKTILTGSQSLDRGDTVLLRAAYPDSCCFLHYGTSKLSYVAWLTDQEMNDNPACVDRPFPGVDVTLCSDEICVDTLYSTIGITGPYSVGDTGYMDRDGYPYFNGRKDDIYDIHGNKVLAVKVENALNSLPQVQEAAVIFENNTLRTHVVLPVLTSPGQGATALRRIIRKGLKGYLESQEIPRDIVFHENLPKNNSGKTVRGLLSAKESITI